MNRADVTGAASPFAMLRRLTQPRAAQERCELCSQTLPPAHRHLLETTSRQIVCACDGCSLTFHGVRNGRFKLIPRNSHALPGFTITDAQWESFALPINLAFFLRDTKAGKMLAFYPSPAGATESLLSTSAWDALVSDNPPLRNLEPDVEAFLVNRVGETRHYLLAPLDVCYELVGLIRIHWRGLSGGDEVWEHIGAFFDRVASDATPLTQFQSEPARQLEVHHA